MSFVVCVTTAAQFIFNKVGSRNFDGILKNNAITKKDSKEDGQNIGASDNSTIRSRFIMSDERTDIKQNGRCEDGLRKGDASLELSFVQGISPSEQMSPRIKAVVDEGKENFGVKLDKKSEVEQKRPLQDPDDGERPSKIAKLDVSISKEEGNNNVMVSMTKRNNKEKAMEVLVKQKDKSENPRETIERDIRPFTSKSQEKSKLSNAKLAKPSSKDTVDEVDNVDYRTKQVTRRPDVVS